MNFFRETLSENGVLSCKRYCGMMILSAAVVAALYFSFSLGLTSNVLTLWQTLITMGGTLVGLSSITNIWGNNKSTAE